MQSELQDRQRLLYLHARTPSVFSDILGYTSIEPVKDYRVEISAEEIDWPYKSVHDAIVDGWQVVQFPHLQAPFDDKDLDVVGYMIKFLFNRTQDNSEPTWNHDPDALNKPRDWNLRDKAEDVNNILSFVNPLGVSQSDHYKETTICRPCWANLLGQT